MTLIRPISILNDENSFRDPQTKPLRKNKGLSTAPQKGLSKPSKTFVQPIKPSAKKDNFASSRRALGDITNNRTNNITNLQKTELKTQKSSQTSLKEDEIDTLFGTAADKQQEAPYISDFDINEITNSLKQIKRELPNLMFQNDEKLDLQLELNENVDIEDQECDGEIDLADCEFDVENLKID